MVSKVSIRPSDFVEGGAVPVDRNLLWKECRFANFDYVNKAGATVASTLAARITYQDDDGAEFIQHYSAADPARFQPSKDGKTLVAVGTAQAISKSSNFYLLMNALVNSGFPENRLSEDISVLDGLYAYHIGIPAPKRSGLQSAAAEGDRERILSVPSQVLRLPGEVKGAKAPAKGKAAPVAAEEAEEDASAETLAIVAALVEKGGKVTRQNVATQAIRSKKPAVAKFVFTPEFQAALMGNGYSLDGEEITTA